MVELLIEWDANIAQKDSEGNNCLDLAIDNNKSYVFYFYLFLIYKSTCYIYIYIYNQLLLLIYYFLMYILINSNLDH